MNSKIGSLGSKNHLYVDTFGMKLALAAGYSPCGSYRFAAKMKELGQGPALTFLSTHPGNDERLENSENFSVTSNGMSCSSLQ
jgi:predicted Zn-dependent protease